MANWGKIAAFAGTAIAAGTAAYFTTNSIKNKQIAAKDVEIGELMTQKTQLEGDKTGLAEANKKLGEEKAAEAAAKNEAQAALNLANLKHEAKKLGIDPESEDLESKVNVRKALKADADEFEVPYDKSDMTKFDNETMGKAIKAEVLAKAKAYGITVAEDSDFDEIKTELKERKAIAKAAAEFGVKVNFEDFKKDEVKTALYEAYKKQCEDLGFTKLFEEKIFANNDYKDEELIERKELLAKAAKYGATVADPKTTSNLDVQKAIDEKMLEKAKALKLTYKDGDEDKEYTEITDENREAVEKAITEREAPAKPAANAAKISGEKGVLKSGFGQTITEAQYIASVKAQHEANPFSEAELAKRIHRSRWKELGFVPKQEKEPCPCPCP
jgi:hypothetical protein